MAARRLAQDALRLEATTPPLPGFVEQSEQRALFEAKGSAMGP
jgi:hypothetical protein